MRGHVRDRPGPRRPVEAGLEPMTLRWTRRPEGSTWGDFGPDDELGRLNLLTPEKVRQGVAEVREGLTFCLSLPLDLPGGNVLNPRRHPPQITPTRRANGRPNMNFPVCEEVDGATDVICDDRALIHLQYSTQWDTLAHVGSLFDADGDGVRAAPTTTASAAAGTSSGPSTRRRRPTSRPGRRRSAIERMAETGMQGRAVMIDLRAASRRRQGDGRLRAARPDPGGR